RDWERRVSVPTRLLKGPVPRRIVYDQDLGVVLQQFRWNALQHHLYGSLRIISDDKYQYPLLVRPVLHVLTRMPRPLSIGRFLSFPDSLSIAETSPRGGEKPGRAVQER